jgi:predicted nucleotidyltransferase
VDDDSFPLYVAGRLAGLPGVEAVTLGGSRAEGTQRPDSDWDFSIYYRGRFDPQALRVDGLIAATGPDPAAPRDLVDDSRSLCSDALRAIYTL